MTTSKQPSCENRHAARGEAISPRSDGVVRIMEICGTHTMAIARGGLRRLLPPSVRLISGPGCPVCVTDQSYIDRAVWLARGQAAGSPSRPIIATYGDMLRVPGRAGSLASARAEGASVEVVYAAEQALELARQNPGRQVVFLAAGFETTAPAAALAVKSAKRQGVSNFSILSAHKRLMPAMHALLAAGDIRIDGFLCPGHVSVVLGWRAYEPIVRQYARPCVVAGFDAPQVLSAVEEILRQLKAGKARALSVYPAVRPEGNPVAQALLEEVFQPRGERWRALGVIPASGLELRPAFAHFDAETRFDLPPAASYDLPGCRCGQVITGRLAPTECPMFSHACTPRNPLGPCMVSSEGACAAAYKYEVHSQPFVQ